MKTNRRNDSSSVTHAAARPAAAAEKKTGAMKTMSVHEQMRAGKIWAKVNMSKIS